MKINKPPKIWDFRNKYYPNFNETSIKLGDTIICPGTISAEVNKIRGNFYEYVGNGYIQSWSFDFLNNKNKEKYENKFRITT